jgi:RimJ/RimL family protein N-acetyltransferase
LLEGRLVNLRTVEKEDIPLLAEWLSNPEFLGEYQGVQQLTKSEFEKMFETDDKHEMRDFFIEKKNGTKIGIITHFYLLLPVGLGRLLEIGYFLLPNERRKGYCSEAVNIMLDYLFLSKDVVRIQASTDVRNLASQKVLEKAGFKKEGRLRKTGFIRGEWADDYLYSILREEWKEPRILMRK